MSVHDFSSDELLIGKIKALTPDTEIKVLLDAYQSNKSLEQNVDLLGNSRTILQKHLANAVKLLQSMDSDYPVLAERISTLKSGNHLTKAVAATAIVHFIQDARAICCLKCKDDFTPYSLDNSSSEERCCRCKRPGHRGCYTDTHVDEEIGVVFLCGECLSSYGIELEVSAQEKDLGVITHSSLLWNEQIKACISKANRMICWIPSYTHNSLLHPQIIMPSYQCL